MEELLKGLRAMLFPEYFAPEPGEIPLGKWLDEKTATEFLEQLPQIRRMLLEDLQAAVESDPAAESRELVARCYPGFYAVTVYRLAHGLAELGVKLLPRMMTEQAHAVTGIDIHPDARIGRRFFIDHGTGTVIGQTAVIGDGVRLYHGVTLGALALRGAMPPAGKRHPSVEDGAVIYANATVLGGDTVIGRGAVIGAHALVTASVPPGAVVRHGSDRAK